MTALANRLEKRTTLVADLSELDATIALHLLNFAAEKVTRDASDADALGKVRRLLATLEAYDVPDAAYARLHVSLCSVNEAPARIASARIELLAGLVEAERGLVTRLRDGVPDERGAALTARRARTEAELASVNAELAARRAEAEAVLAALRA